MATYLELAELLRNDDFRKRCAFAVLEAAIDTIGSDPSWRKEWARRVNWGQILATGEGLVTQVLIDNAVRVAGASASDAQIKTAVLARLQAIAAL